MRIRQNMLLLLVVAGLLSFLGCTPRNGESLGASSEWRLQNLEANQLETQEQSRAEKAEVASRLQALEKRLARVEKDLAESLHGAAAAQAEAEALRAAMNAKKYADSSVVASVKVEQHQPATKTVVPPASPASADSQPATVQVKSASARVPVASGETERYQAGVNAVMNEDITSGRSILEAFLADFPDSGLAPNARYWLGETYYHEKRYAEAILTFKEVVRKYPKHGKAAAAMLKTGFAYDMLGDKSNARFYLQTLVDEYPGSEPAGLARNRLKSL
ncbi:tol-pal system protein YbgF [Oleidesulfovibrio sp.]|uniref:tol-pal system protein YbgF n=1 Tax=Oleidesulfovibrio sp. TaxID=2909707 RepID=UPI003A8723FE